jgi:hypothetical protein
LYGARWVTLFVPLAGAECSTVEPPPFFGRDEAELRACAIDAMDQVPEADIAAMEVSVDGQTISDLQPYRVSTPLFQLLLPEENLLGSTAPVANSVADGYQVLLAPLAEGSHVISWSVPGPEGMMTVTYRLTVAAPQILDPLASPEASPVS